jgi:hypothetical protein
MAISAGVAAAGAYGLRDARASAGFVGVLRRYLVEQLL